MDATLIFDLLQGIPVFTGTSVPIQTLIDYWQGGLPLYEFLLDFPTVEKYQAKAVLVWFAAIKKAGKLPAAELQALGEKKTTK